jgi:hypothetical protein
MPSVTLLPTPPMLLAPNSKTSPVTQDKTQEHNL